MIVASLLLILVAVGSLVLGLAGGSSTLLVVSIAASLLAAVALVVGARQAVAARSAPDRSGLFRRAAPTAAAGPRVDIPMQHVPPTAGVDEPGWRQPPGPSAAVGDPQDPFGAAPAGPNPWADQPGADPAGGTASEAAGREEPAPPADPADEPPPEPVTAERAALVAGLVLEVRVVDGRPRYHLAGCRHLLGRDDEPLPVAEAVELGFTPCGQCTPDTFLLAGARPS
ncbi:hypothetical protein AB0H57_14935 [Micromonospora sp. NPDC050686]|uniref:hypothetical protein n=1 Tax=Micromonospora sp. NPDC050686 TaxID=3154631 RepID=UPI0033C29847